MSPQAEEFSRTLEAMELGLPRREALQNLRRRTEVPELSNFVLAPREADALGMPIRRALGTQAGENRLTERLSSRGNADRFSDKTTVPRVRSTFPPVFIVVLGPVLSEIGRKR